MIGLIAAHERMNTGGVLAVIQAAAVSYWFVFLHPFEDGNGRIHRFLLHNIFARRSFTPEGAMFPISASMLKNPVDYDTSLEAFSRSFMSLAEYTLDENGRMVSFYGRPSKFADFFCPIFGPCIMVRKAFITEI
jgi:hypothetical protein